MRAGAPTSRSPTPPASASGIRSPSTTATVNSTGRPSRRRSRRPQQILSDSEKTGLIYITDEDARPLGSAHPHAHLWDNGADPAAELNRVLQIRTAALVRFGPDAIQEGMPLAQLEDTLVPLYLFHRYQTEAAAKKSGPRLPVQRPRRWPGAFRDCLPADQRAALTAVLRTLSPSILTLLTPSLIPAAAASRLAPHAGELPLRHWPYLRSRGCRRIRRRLHLALVFNPQRANRLSISRPEQR